MEDLPSAGQALSVVVVRAEEILVLQAEVLESSSERLVLRLNDIPEGGYSLLGGARATLMYNLGEQMLRLQTRVTDCPTPDVLRLIVERKLSKRERREFLRVSASLPFDFRVLDDASLPEALRTCGESRHPAASQWPLRPVDISGSGAGFVSDSEVRLGQHVLLNLQLPFKKPLVVSVVGLVVRAEGLPDGRFEVGVQFVETPVQAQDLIINYVFKSHYELIEDMP